MPTFPSLILAPPLLGFAFNWALQGIFSIQVYIYYLCFPNDSTTLKCIVYVMYIYEWVQTALATLDMYNHLKDGDYVVYSVDLLSQGLSWITLYLMPALTAAAVQSFYAWRIAVLSQRRLSSMAIIPVVITACCSGLIGAIDMKRLPYARRDAVLSWGVATEVWLWGSVFADAMIAGCMIHLLRRFKTLREDTNLLVNRLIRLIAETGCLTAVGAITVLVFYTAFQETLLAACPLLLLSKLYANTLLITLNNRAFMNAHVSGANIGHSPLILHMTSRQTGQNSLAAAAPSSADAERPVEVTLPADTESYTAEAAK